MCLYPKLIKNKKYLPNKKNGYNAPICKEEIFRYVTADCGKCLECRKKKMREWKVRLIEELRYNHNAIFVTLTLNNESLEKMWKPKDYIRRFLERYRKKTKKSVKHWFVTEAGEENGRLHFHGIIWDWNNEIELNKTWKYGFVYIGNYVNEKSINYIVKYMLKPNLKFKDFKQEVFCSAGIGKNFINRPQALISKKKLEEFYRLNNGQKIAMPKYYKNKLFDDNTREKLWKEKIEKGIAYILGQPCSMDNEQLYTKMLVEAREKDKYLFYRNINKDEQEKRVKNMLKQRKYLVDNKQIIIFAKQEKNKEIINS